MKIPLNSDVWSLGCVFSLAATYVVLGSQGVVQYNRVRQWANRIRKDTFGDSFHDGSEVLPEVTFWHTYLRHVARRSDDLTRRVLDLVDESMLIGDPKRRADADDICKRMSSRICKSNNTSWDHLTPDFDFFVEEIEGLAGSEMTDQPPTLHYGDSVRSDSPSSKQPAAPTIHSDFKSTHDLLSQRVLPVIMRTQPPTPTVSRSSTSMYTASLRQQGYRNQLSQLSLRPTSTTTHVAAEHKGIVNMWWVQSELKNLNKAKKLSMVGRLFRRSLKALSVKSQKQQSNRDELGSYYESRDIVGSPRRLDRASSNIFHRCSLRIMRPQWASTGTMPRPCSEY